MSRSADFSMMLQTGNSYNRNDTVRIRNTAKVSHYISLVFFSLVLIGNMIKKVVINVKFRMILAIILSFSCVLRFLFRNISCSLCISIDNPGT